MRAVVVLALLASCSFAVIGERPFRDRHGVPTCHSYALPVVESVFAIASLALVGLGAALATDPELRGTALAVAVPFGLVTAALTASAVSGFRNSARCRKVLNDQRGP